MGAEYNYQCFNGDVNIHREFEDLIKEADDYYGHQEGYSGSWNCASNSLQVDSKIWSSFEKVDEHYTENCQKWATIAAKYHSTGKVPTKGQQNKLDKLQESLRVLKVKHENLQSDFHQKLNKANKTGLKGCQSCSSKINTKYIKQGQCPVCHESMLTDTDTKRLETIGIKINKVSNDITKIRIEIDKGGKLGKVLKWYICCLASC